MPWELVIWNLVDETGWTLDYIDSLPLSRLHEWLQVKDGREKAGEQIAKRNKR